MPIIAQKLIPINISNEHKIIINQFKTCNCLNKSILINQPGYNNQDLMKTLDSLTKDGLITCNNDTCCIKSEQYNSFINKLNKLK